MHMLCLKPFGRVQRPLHSHHKPCKKQSAKSSFFLCSTNCIAIMGMCAALLINARVISMLRFFRSA